jgi:hypothetical protein
VSVQSYRDLVAWQKADLARSAEVGRVLSGLMRSMSGQAAGARNTAPLTPGAWRLPPEG